MIDRDQTRSETPMAMQRGGIYPVLDAIGVMVGVLIC